MLRQFRKRALTPPRCPPVEGVRFPPGALLLLILLLALPACAGSGWTQSWTQSAFARSASHAGSEFAAAATTLRDVHMGRLSTAYASASFVNYVSQLNGLGTTITKQAGAPNQRMIHHLLTLYAAAWPAIESPCLPASCDWRSQLQRLNAASRAFLEAGSA